MKFRFIIVICLLLSFLFISILLTNYVVNNLHIIAHSELVKKTKKFFPNNVKNFVKDNSINQFFLINSSVKKLKKNLNDKNILNKKKIILKHFLLNESQIKFNKEDPKGTKVNYIDNNIELYSVKFYEMTEFGILKKNKQNNRKLLIYIQGHRGNPYDFKSFLDLKKQFSKLNYDILSLSMSNLGYNEKGYITNTLNFPGINKKKKRHAIYSEYKDKNNPDKYPLSLMLTGNYYLIKNILKKYNYEETIAVGISGGGWYVTILPALIENIDISISFSGTRSIPFQYYSCCKDFDSSYSKIYNFLDYEDLYYLATLDFDGHQNRYHYQIYDFNEGEIIGGKFSESMKKISDKFNNKFFKVKLKYDGKHDINLKMIHKIINNIKSVKNK